MIKPVREDVDKIYIIAKGGHNISKIENMIAWMPEDLPRIQVVDRIPDDLCNKARYLLIIHYSAIDRRITANISDFIKKYVDQGFLICYISEVGIGNVVTSGYRVNEKNIQTEIGIAKSVANNMVDVSYESGVFDSYGSLREYLEGMLPTEKEALSGKKEEKEDIQDDEFDIGKIIHF